MKDCNKKEILVPMGTCAVIGTAAYYYWSRKLEVEQAKQDEWAFIIYMGYKGNIQDEKIKELANKGYNIIFLSRKGIQNNKNVEELI